jgi:hypothetical protein
MHGFMAKIKSEFLIENTRLYLKACIKKARLIGF